MSENSADQDISVLPPVEAIRQELGRVTVTANTLRKMLRLAMQHERDLSRVESEFNHERGNRV